MNIEYFKWYSPFLRKEMELKVYGSGGKPFIIFPTQCGKFYQAEVEGIISAISSFLDEGKMFLIAVDSIDGESWSNNKLSHNDKGVRHLQYEQYILKETLPFIYKRLVNQDIKVGTIGFSMGAYHAANFLFKHPSIFDTVIAISGFYNLSILLGECVEEIVYYNSPNLFLKNLEDEKILNELRKCKIIICSGQGAWEEEMLKETTTLKATLEYKNIPAWVDIWGEDVNHDWIWWRKMLPYFIGKLDL